MTTTLRVFAPLLLASACSLHLDDPFDKHDDNPPEVFPNEPITIGPPPFFGATTVAATPPPPISGGTLLVLSRAAGSIAIASDPDRDVIHVVDLDQKVKITGIALNAGDEPGRLIEDAAGRVHVALRHGGAIVTLDPKTWQVSDRRDVCGAPRGLVYDASLDQIHVACAGGELVSLPANGGSPARTVVLDDDLRDVVLLNGRMFVSRFHTAQVLAVDADGLVTRRFAPSTTVDSAGNVFTPDAAFRLIADPETNTLYMAHQRVSNGTVATTEPGGYGAGSGCSTGIVQGTVSAMNPDAPTPQTPGVPGLVLPVDIARTTYGQIGVVSAGSGHTPGQARLQSMTADALTTSGNCGFFSSGTFDDSIGQPIAVAAWNDAFVIQSREPAQLYLNDGSYQTITLSEESREDTGHAVFHSDSSAGLACASCHLEGGEDGHVWTFDNSGPRRTQSLRGGVLGTEPFHWDGDQHDFNDIMANVFEHRMAGPVLGADQSLAVRTWVNNIPANPKRLVQDAAAVARGEAIFNDAENVGCVTCHAGKLMTDNATVDVGTGGTFQVPSLRGIAWRAPYLHDGRAATLVERFGPNGGGDDHGVTSKLSADQINDLVAYLQTL